MNNLLLRASFASPFKGFCRRDSGTKSVLYQLSGMALGTYLVVSQTRQYKHFQISGCGNRQAITYCPVNKNHNTHNKISRRPARMGRRSCPHGVE